MLPRCYHLWENPLKTYDLIELWPHEVRCYFPKLYPLSSSEIIISFMTLDRDFDSTREFGEIASRSLMAPYISLWNLPLWASLTSQHALCSYQMLSSTFSFIPKRNSLKVNDDTHKKPSKNWQREVRCGSDILQWIFQRRLRFKHFFHFLTFSQQTTLPAGEFTKSVSKMVSMLKWSIFEKLW